jgi:hypothetical protein
MKIQQWHFVADQWKNNFTDSEFDLHQAQLVLAFGESALSTNREVFNTLKDRFPKAHIIISSTAGEIIGDEVFDNSMVVTAIQFENTSIRCSVANINQYANSFETGKHLMNELLTSDLSSVFVISDGTYINGSELVAGLNEINKLHGKNIPVTGGLAGDGARFDKTFVGLNQMPTSGVVVAIGFYGNRIKIGHGSFGGWDEFGTERVVTRCDKNILYEIDDKSALDLYKEYLGPYKNELPGSALLFPLSIKEPNCDERVVRTILSIDEDEKSMSFAGNLPVGSNVRFMKANFDRLIDGSSIAAQKAFTSLSNTQPELIILISCVGRKLILQDRTDEEVEAVRKIFGGRSPITGFYSYGEISPFNPLTRCELHNQTMTITTLCEV